MLELNLDLLLCSECNILFTLIKGEIRRMKIFLSSQRIHVYTECDTISVAFRTSSVTFVQLHKKHVDMRSAAEVFSNRSATHNQIKAHGNICFLRGYGVSKKEKSLTQSGTIYSPS